MDHFPDDLMLKIFSFLSLRDNFNKQLVCRKWHELLQDFSLWTSIRIKDDSHIASIVTDDIIGQWLVQWGSHVRTLQLRYCRKLTNFVGQLISNSCPSIENIDLQGCIGIGDFGMALIAENCFLVKKVNLFMTGATDVGLSKLLSNVPKICSIKLPSKGNCFRSLHAVCTKCISLDTLIVNDVIPFDETDPIVSDVAITKLTARFNSIRKISLNWCWYVTDQCLAAIGENCKNLIHLVVRECHQVTDDGVVKFITLCPSLKKLQLGRLYGVTDQMADGFVNKNNSILNLKLIDTSVTDKGVSRILEKTPELRALLVGEYCLNASKLNGELIFACSKYCKKLLELVIVTSNSIEDGMLLDIAENLPQLNVLLLSSCARVSKAGLIPLVSSLKNLRELRICKCEEFDDDVLSVAVRELVVLNSLELYGCNKLTNNGIKQLLKKRPSCHLRF